MKSRAWVFAPFLLAGIWYFAFEHTGVYAWQDLPPQTDGQQFRIILGLKDMQARTWQGKAELTGAEIVRLAGWRFSMHDRTNNDATFNTVTKIQPPEDQ